MQLLKQSTAASVMVGPVLDGDGLPYTSATVGNFNITKNGTTAALASPATATHSHNGHYVIAFGTGNVDTLGRLDVSVNASGYGMTLHRYTVVTANQFDALITNGTATPAAIASQTRTELTTELARIDVATSTRLASASYTTPPTAAAIADTTLSGLTSGPTSGGNWPNGSFGRQILIGSSTQREVAVTGSNHVAADIHELQPAVITSADFATDAISANAVSSGAVTKIVTGVWSALTSGFSVTGSAGEVVKALASMLEFVGGLWRWKASSLTQAPTGSGGGGTVNVLPAVGISAERSAGVVLNPFVGETISQAITLYQTDGATPINLSGKTLELVFDTRSGIDVAVVDNASITVSGTNSNTITFAYPSEVTASERVLRVALRDASAPKTVYLSGLCKVSLAPFND